MATGTKVALVLGGTGETGKCVMQELMKSEKFGKIIMVNRRSVEVHGPAVEKVDQRIVDFEKLDPDQLKGADVAFCCLGTTRAKAGKAGFVKVDHDYVVESARHIETSGTCKEFHLVSSMNANPNAWALYTSTKGKADEAVKKMSYGHVSIYRPGLLITERSEGRTLEKFAQSLAGFVDRNNKYSISTADLAKAMVANALVEKADARKVLENADILSLAKKSEK